jgi:glutaredoxin
MKPIIRAFFRTLRIVLGPFMQVWEFLTRPKGVVRAPAAQRAVEQQCQSMVLYQFTTCPFCIKVRQEMRRLTLPIERRDAQHDQKNKDDLLKGGGAVKVPCLKVTDAKGQSQWIYESGAIIAYLRSRFAVA